MTRLLILSALVFLSAPAFAQQALEPQRQQADVDTQDADPGDADSDVLRRLDEAFGSSAGVDAPDPDAEERARLEREQGYRERVVEPGAAGRLSSRPGSVVVLRGLDKVTATTRDFELPIGESADFGALTITARYCRKRPPEETPETFAFLEIVDRRVTDPEQNPDGVRIFSGWMFASNPALNPLEHAVYDVWPIDCRT